MRPIVLSVAGSDCSGGAGIQADLKAIEAGGGFAATALTAITVQTGTGVRRSVALDPALVAEQVEAVLEDLPVAAVKSGMLACAGTVEALARALTSRRGIPFVLDPVLAAESGATLLPSAAVPVLLERLVPLATLLTPNVPEAEILTGTSIRDLADAERAARRLLERGAGSVLVKGGHLQDAPATDLLVSPQGTHVYRGEYIETAHARGTGCIYASAIAVRLAHGVPLPQAVAQAKAFVTESIRHGFAVARGRGPADPMHALAARVGRLHVLTSDVEIARVASAAGADTVQFREKIRQSTADLVETARRIREITASHGTTLVIDDRADVAAAVRADGVHLGAHDLHPSDARRLLGRTALIGRTANSLEEALQVADEPVDYLGVGPVYGTSSKTNPAPVLGVRGLARIAAAVDKPVIAIGGMRADRVAEVLEAGAHGVAVLSAIASAADPALEVARMREAIASAVARRDGAHAARAQG